MEYVIDKKWKWVQCNLVIKRLPQKENQQGIYQSLQAQVQLISEQPDIKNFHSDIIMEKGFQFQDGKGFIWHKSWYIPQIVIKLSTKITKLLKDENHIKKMYCEMLSAYPFKKDQHFYLEQIKLDGDTTKQFNKKGQVTFTNIKFSQTSFNKNKNKFSIILVIYTTYKKNQKSIIKSYISSPIHVDSRKQARKKISANTFIQDQITLTKFVNPLEGSQKLINQNFCYQDLLTIPGFIKYYTAANVRFKIKHPYYIGYHFDNVFDIYYNSQEAQTPVDVLDIIFQNQVKEQDRAKVKPKPKKQFYTDNKQILKKTCPKILLFLIKNSAKQCYLIKDENGGQQERIYEGQSKVPNLKKHKSKEDVLQSLNLKQNISKQNQGSKNNIKNTQNIDKDQGLQEKKETYQQFPPQFMGASNMNGLFYQQNPYMQGSLGQNMNNLHSLYNSNFVYFPTNQQYYYGNMTNDMNMQKLGKNENKEQKQVQQNIILNKNNQQKQNQKLNQNKNQSNTQKQPKSQKSQKNIPNQQDIKYQQNSSDIKFQQKKDSLEQNKKQNIKNEIFKQQEYIKKINSIFQSWKFNFIYIKKSDGGLTVLNKKWVHIPKEQLLESFKEHTQKRAQKMNQLDRNDSAAPQPASNNYLTYDIHQVIVLQKSKHSGVKLQQHYLNYQS